MESHLGTATKRKMHTPCDATTPPPGIHPTDTLREMRQRDVQGWTQQPCLQGLKDQKRSIPAGTGRTDDGLSLCWTAGRGVHSVKERATAVGLATGKDLQFKGKTLQLETSGRTPLATNIKASA